MRVCSGGEASWDLRRGPSGLDGKGASIHCLEVCSIEDDVLIRTSLA